MHFFGYTLFVLGLMALSLLLAGIALSNIGGLSPSDRQAALIGLPLAVGAIATGLLSEAHSQIRGTGATWTATRGAQFTVAKTQGADSRDPISPLQPRRTLAIA